MMQQMREWKKEKQEHTIKEERREMPWQSCIEKKEKERREMEGGKKNWEEKRKRRKKEKGK